MAVIVHLPLSTAAGHLHRLAGADRFEPSVGPIELAPLPLTLRTDSQ